MYIKIQAFADTFIPSNLQCIKRCSTIETLQTLRTFRAFNQTSIRFFLSLRSPLRDEEEGYSGSGVPLGVMYIRPPPRMTYSDTWKFTLLKKLNIKGEIFRLFMKVFFISLTNYILILSQWIFIIFDFIVTLHLFIFKLTTSQITNDYDIKYEIFTFFIDFI